MAPPVDDCFPPENNTTDLANSFIDWAPAPPDSNMGLWGRVELVVSGPVAVAHPVVVTTLLAQGSGNLRAALDVGILVQNWAAASVAAGAADLRLELPELNVSATIPVPYLAAQSAPVTVWFNSSLLPQLVVDSPQLWWPGHFGAPALYNLSATLFVSGVPSDSVTAQIGLRAVESHLDANGNRLYRVNGRPFIVLGAGWSPDLFLRDNASSLSDQFRLINHVRSNF